MQIHLDSLLIFYCRTIIIMQSDEKVISKGHVRSLQAIVGLFQMPSHRSRTQDRQNTSAPLSNA